MIGAFSQAQQQHANSIFIQTKDGKNKHWLNHTYHQRCNYIVPGILRGGGGEIRWPFIKKGGIIYSQK